MKTVYPTPALTTSIKSTLIAPLLLLTLLFSTHAAALDKINTTFFGNVAIKGYDTVAYFTENKPVKGDKRFQTEWMGLNGDLAVLKT